MSSRRILSAGEAVGGDAEIVGVTSTSGTQSVTQSAWKLLQLEQTRQFAERAAQNARALQSKASDAQSAADRAQEYSRTLRVKADMAQSVAVQADRGIRTAESSSQIGPGIISEITQAAQPAVAVPVQTPTQPAQPTVNTQGETIGTVINVTA